MSAKEQSMWHGHRASVDKSHVNPDGQIVDVYVPYAYEGTWSNDFETAAEVVAWLKKQSSGFYDDVTIRPATQEYDRAEFIAAVERGDIT